MGSRALGNVLVLRWARAAIRTDVGVNINQRKDTVPPSLNLSSLKESSKLFNIFLMQIIPYQCCNIVNKHTAQCMKSECVFSHWGLGAFVF